MTATFEYRVCLVQQSRVTFVDGRWAGQVPHDHEDVRAALDSCPVVWDYLGQAGAEGWELVTSGSRAEPQGQVVEILYLKRRR